MQLIHADKLQPGQLIVDRTGPVFAVNEVMQADDGRFQVAMTDVLNLDAYFATFEPKEWLVVDEPLTIELQGSKRFEGTITIGLARLFDDQRRPVYQWVIHDLETQVIAFGTDLHGEVEGKPNVERAAYSLLGRLLDEGQAYESSLASGVEQDPFKTAVGEFAHGAAGAIRIARAELTQGIEL